MKTTMQNKAAPKRIGALEKEKNRFLENNVVSKPLLILNIILALAYFAIITFGFARGNAVLYSLIIIGEVFHLWQLLTYLYTIWEIKEIPPPVLASYITPAVDVFITVAGEPVEIVEETVVAAKAMVYPNFRVHILNDGYVAKKDNWQEIEALATRLGVNCITRREPGGAKAGNINNALRITGAPLFAIFDADHVPHADFLEETVPHFGDPQMGFVQSPQYYKNAALNRVTQGAWEQQALFFGPICKGKNRLNVVTMCGTNMLIKREAILEVGGMCEESIAEDFVTGMFIHERGWKSRYVGKVLAEGLAPEDFLSYYKQQFRWARGSFDVIFRYNLLFRPKLTLTQRLQYFSSVSFFLSGFIVLMNALVPMVFLFTGLVPFKSPTMALAAVFLPYIFLTLFSLQRSSNFTFSFNSLAFAMAGFMIHIKAFFAALTGRKSAFAVTSKRAVHGNFLHLVIPHILYIVLLFVGVGVALVREELSPSVLTNFAWAGLNAAVFFQFVKAALPERARATVKYSGRVSTT